MNVIGYIQAVPSYYRDIYHVFPCHLPSILMALDMEEVVDYTPEIDTY